MRLIIQQVWDCSDHEVNIKIAFAQAMEDKKLDLKKRNKLLEKMTDEVAELVLRDNYLQTQAISISERLGVSILETQESFMEFLENKNLLDREIEFLPNKEEIAKRLANKKGLTRPEISVLLAYAKLNLYKEVFRFIPSG